MKTKTIALSLFLLLSSFMTANALEAQNGIDEIESVEEIGANELGLPTTYEEGVDFGRLFACAEEAQGMPKTPPTQHYEFIYTRTKTDRGYDVAQGLAVGYLIHKEKGCAYDPSVVEIPAEWHLSEDPAACHPGETQELCSRHEDDYGTATFCCLPAKSLGDIGYPNSFCGYTWDQSSDPPTPTEVLGARGN